MINQRRRRVRSVSFLMSAAALLAAGCGSSSKSGASSTTSTVASSGTAAPGGSTQGLTASTITLGHIADISGPIPGLMQGTSFGIDAWAAYVNSTGGIDGRKVIIDDKDSALNCNTFTNDITALAKSTFALVGAASAVDGCGDAVLKANPTYADLPAFFVSTTYNNDPNVFSDDPHPPGWPDTGYLYVKDKFGAAAIQKFAILYATTTVDVYNQSAHAAESIGYKLAYSRGVGYTETNFTSDILRMKAAGVEVVDLTATATNQVAAFLTQAAQQDFHPDAVITYAYDNTLFKLMGNPDDANDIVLDLPFAMYLGQDAAITPEINVMTSWLQKTHPGAPMSQYVIDAWTEGLLFQQAFEAAGSSPTQQSFLAALSRIHSFTADGLLPPENVGGRIPSPCQIIGGADNGSFVRINPPKSGYDCDGTYVNYPS